MKLAIICLLMLAGYCTCADPNDGKMRGVNLGGWLVLEPFINPSLLGGIGDEWNFCAKFKNDPENLNRLRRHWDTWVSEDNIKDLISFGITHFRIPIGYWIVFTPAELEQYNEPWLVGGWDYLVRALKWIQKYGGKAIIDLHAAPGRQNPWPFTGKTNDCTWGTGDTMQRTYETLDRVSQRIKAFEQDPELNNVVVGFEVMNEAFPPILVGGLGQVMEYYIKGYDVVRKHLPAERYMYVIEEAFSYGAFAGFMNDTKYKNVIMDVHTYQCFDPAVLQYSYDAHLNLACALGANKVKMQTLPTFTGEWSSCYKEPSDTAAAEPYPFESERRFMQQYNMAQMNAYETGIGWFWWNFKTESAPMWDYYVGVRGGWLPCTLPSPYSDMACPVGPWNAELFTCPGWGAPNNTGVEPVTLSTLTSTSTSTLTTTSGNTEVPMTTTSSSTSTSTSSTTGVETTSEPSSTSSSSTSTSTTEATTPSTPATTNEFIQNKDGSGANQIAAGLLVVLATLALL